eukprot:4144340-Amphidinium_carterae.1
MTGTPRSELDSEAKETADKMKLRPLAGAVDGKGSLKTNSIYLRSRAKAYKVKEPSVMALMWSFSSKPPPRHEAAKQLQQGPHPSTPPLLELRASDPPAVHSHEPPAGSHIKEKRPPATEGREQDDPTIATSCGCGLPQASFIQPPPIVAAPRRHSLPQAGQQ